MPTPAASAAPAASGQPSPDGGGRRAERSLSSGGLAARSPAQQKRAGASCGKNNRTDPQIKVAEAWIEAVLA
jgi:hypothetical protein